MITAFGFPPFTLAVAFCYIGTRSCLFYGDVALLSCVRDTVEDKRPLCQLSSERLEDNWHSGLLSSTNSDYLGVDSR